MRDVLLTRQVEPDVVETVQLLTSEVVTNALVHGMAEPVLVVRLAPGRVRIEVHDESPDMPVRRAVGPTAETGRGLSVVDQLAKDWGVERAPRGKRVWFEVAR